MFEIKLQQSVADHYERDQFKNGPLYNPEIVSKSPYVLYVDDRRVGFFRTYSDAARRAGDFFEDAVMVAFDLQSSVADASARARKLAASLRALKESEEYRVSD